MWLVISAIADGGSAGGAVEPLGTDAARSRHLLRHPPGAVPRPGHHGRAGCQGIRTYGPLMHIISGRSSAITCTICCAFLPKNIERPNWNGAIFSSDNVPVPNNRFRGKFLIFFGLESGYELTFNLCPPLRISVIIDISIFFTSLYFFSFFREVSFVFNKISS